MKWKSKVILHQPFYANILRNFFPYSKFLSFSVHFISVTSHQKLWTRFNFYDLKRRPSPQEKGGNLDPTYGWKNTPRMHMARRIAKFYDWYMLFSATLSFWYLVTCDAFQSRLGLKVCVTCIAFPREKYIVIVSHLTSRLQNEKLLRGCFSSG